MSPSCADSGRSATDRLRFRRNPLPIDVEKLQIGRLRVISKLHKPFLPALDLGWPSQFQFEERAMLAEPHFASVAPRDATSAAAMRPSTPALSAARRRLHAK